MCIFLKRSYAFLVSALHIYVTLSYNIDYECPYNITDDYDAYFIHKPLRFNTRKLNVDDYYLSVYNVFDWRMPLLNEKTYKTYSYRYHSTRSDAKAIQKNDYENISIIEKQYLNRKIFDNKRSYHTTRAEFYEMNKNFIKVIAIRRMLTMMSLLYFKDEDFDSSIINMIKKQERLSFENFRQDYNKSDFSAETTVEALTEEQYLKIRELMALLPTKEDDIDSYEERFTRLIQFMDENCKNINRCQIAIDKLSQEQIEALRSKHPLKNETYNFYLVRSKVYEFVPFHFKFCQDHFNLFKNEKEADLRLLFGFPRKIFFKA